MFPQIRDDPFVAFGANPYDPQGQRPIVRVKARSKAKLREEVRKACPKVAGVYGMVSRDGQLIYVGKSKHLRVRLLSYFRDKVAEEKPGRILRETRGIVWEDNPGEFAALLREQQLIRHWRPRFNVQHQPKRRQPTYVCLGRSPFTCVYLTRTPTKKDLFVGGPFHSSRLAGRAVDLFNRRFGLRDCANSQPMLFSDQLQLFAQPRRCGCLRYEMRTCLGPCTGSVSQTRYHSAASETLQCLQGDNADLTAELQRDMAAAAAEQDYERAAEVRDDLEAVLWLRERLAALDQVRREYNFIYPVKEGQRHVWYLVRGGELHGAVPVPQTPFAADETRTLLKSWARGHTSLSGPGVHHPSTMLLVASWFRKRPKELRRTLKIATALRKCSALLRTAA